MNQSEIQQILAHLVGLPLRCIGRAADLLWVHFGEMKEVPARRGDTRSLGDWALHIQCPWRITKPPAILVANGDCYYKADIDEPYDWDAGGESRFDSHAAPLNREFESLPPRVEAVVVDTVGGFSLRLSNGYCLDVFPSNSTGCKSEHWRFFQPRKDERHFVFPEYESDAG
jgi:hypothetical protein